MMPLSPPFSQARTKRILSDRGFTRARGSREEAARGLGRRKALVRLNGLSRLAVFWAMILVFPRKQ